MPRFSPESPSFSGLLPPTNMFTLLVGKRGMGVYFFRGPPKTVGVPFGCPSNPQQKKVPSTKSRPICHSSKRLRVYFCRRKNMVFSKRWSHAGFRGSNQGEPSLHGLKAQFTPLCEVPKCPADGQFGGSTGGLTEFPTRRAQQKGDSATNIGCVLAWNFVLV